MDPALQELMNGEPQEEVEVLIKAKDIDKLGDNLRLISRFGEIASARLKRKNIEYVWKQVECLKASRLISIDQPILDLPNTGIEEAGERQAFFPEKAFSNSFPQTGKSIIAILDWGFDVTHPKLRFPNGETKFLSIWDQSAPYDGHNKYGYGRFISREEINKALLSGKPFDALAYHPDPDGVFVNGTHGTHVAGIASGIAPHLDLIGIHLSTGKIPKSFSLGDSTRIVEALDYVRANTGERPVSINMSLGSMGGPHTGDTPVEQVIDHLLTSRPGLVICQSAGNYFETQTHAQGIVTKNHNTKLEWIVGERDRTHNELEIWFQPEDDISICLIPPGEGTPKEIRLKDIPQIESVEKEINAFSAHRYITDGDGRKVGVMYLRKMDSVTGLTHFDGFLYPNAPSGKWIIELVGQEVYSGAFHAWIERDPAGQSHFSEGTASPMHTTGTIAHSKYGIAVGAYDPHDPALPLGPFSSAGWVLDRKRRIKPEIIAPGVGISSARSSGQGESRSRGEETLKSGTSMAAPQVAGAMALMLDNVDRPLRIQESRQLLFSSADPYHNEEEIPQRYGHGMLNIQKLLVMANEFHQDTNTVEDTKENTSVDQLPLMDKANSSQCKNQGVEHLNDSEDSRSTGHPVRQLALEKVIEEVLTQSTGNSSIMEMDQNLQVDTKDQEIDTLSPNNDSILKRILVRSMPPQEAERIERESLPVWTSIFANTAASIVSDLFTNIARPGEKLELPLKKGDILIRMNGENGLEQALILEPPFTGPEKAIDNGQESILPGKYVRVIEKSPAGDFRQIARRITDPDGKLNFNQLVIRPHRDKQKEDSFGEAYDMLHRHSALAGTTWNTYIYVIGTDQKGNSDYNVMRKRLIQITPKTQPYLIMSFDFHAAQSSGGNIEFRFFYRKNSSVQGHGSQELPHSLNQVFRMIEINRKLLRVKHLHFLTHFSDDKIYFSNNQPGFDIGDVRASIRNLTDFKGAFDADPWIKIHGCQLDKSILRHIGAYCQNNRTDTRERALNFVRSRIKNSFVFKFAQLLNKPIWAGPIGTYSSYHCRTLPAQDDGKRFCIEQQRFQRTLRFYEATYRQFFSRASKENIYDFTYHMKYKPRLLGTNTAIPPCASNIPARGNDYNASSYLAALPTASIKPVVSKHLAEARPAAGVRSKNASFYIPFISNPFIADGNNPRKRMYIVTTGPNNRNTHNVKFVFAIENKNDHLNLSNTFFLVRLLAQDRSGGEHLIPLGEPKTSNNYKRISGREIEDESYESFTFTFNLGTIRRAYQKLLDKASGPDGTLNSHKIVLETQFYWMEFPTERFFNIHRFAFYLVRPIELVKVRDMNPNELDNPDPFGNQFATPIAINATNRPIVLEIAIQSGVINTQTGQVQSSLKKIDIQKQDNTTTGTIGVSRTNSSELSLGLSLDNVVSAGLKAGRSTTVSGQVSHSITYSRATTTEITKAYASSKTLTKNITKSFKSTHTISPPAGKASRNTYYVKPIFRPVEVTIYDYSDVNQYGFARKRKVHTHRVMWVFQTYYYFNVEA